MRARFRVLSRLPRVLRICQFSVNVPSTVEYFRVAQCVRKAHISPEPWLAHLLQVAGAAMTALERTEVRRSILRTPISSAEDDCARQTHGCIDF